MKIIVVGDVCEDVLIAGPSSRLSRDTPGLPVVDVELTLAIPGGASVAFRQLQVLGGEAWLVPTGPAAKKSRLFAATDGASREVARWDEGWPSADLTMFFDLFRRVPSSEGGALLYSQVRPGRPLQPIVSSCRQVDALRCADSRHPSYFAGFDVLKIGMDDAWEALRQPRPQRTPQRAAETAQAFGQEWGYRLVVVTMGPDGYAAWSEGAHILAGGIEGGRYSSGAGDIFAATLTWCLAEKHEVRDALTAANVAAGLACRKEEHLATVTLEEVLRETGSPLG